MPLLTSMKEHLIKPYEGADVFQPRFYKGNGCAKCGDSGYKGRTSIGEVLLNTMNMKRIIVNGTRPEDVAKELDAQDFITLKQDGLLKVIMGITTVEEVLATTKEDAS